MNDWILEPIVAEMCDYRLYFNDSLHMFRIYSNVRNVSWRQYER